MKVCWTSGAGEYSALPSWDALIVQGPTPITVTALPFMVQTSVVSAWKRTCNLEDVVAITGNGGEPYFFSESGPNVIVWRSRAETEEMPVIRISNVSGDTARIDSPASESGRER